MFSLSKFADYSIVVLAVFVASPRGSLFSSSAIANRTHIHFPTTSKILRLLNKGGIVESIRGTGGGYRLSRDPIDITMFDVLVSIDGPLALTACVESSEDDCSAKPICSMNGGWDLLNAKVIEAFKSVSIIEICSPVDFINIKV